MHSRIARAGKDRGKSSAALQPRDLSDQGLDASLNVAH